MTYRDDSAGSAASSTGKSYKRTLLSSSVDRLDGSRSGRASSWSLRFILYNDTDVTCVLLDRKEPSSETLTTWPLTVSDVLLPPAMVLHYRQIPVRMNPGRARQFR